MTASVYDKIWELSPRVKEPEAYAMLKTLTQQLINIYTEEGRLDENPFSPTTKRTLSLPSAEINYLLKSSTCLVTGGLGCVGSSLVDKLLTFETANIIVLDNRPCNEKKGADNRIIYVQADVRDRDRLDDIFETFMPDYVFHTAARRDPGYAETHIQDAVTTNIIGTLNVVQACEKSKSVKQCVFSSTGKASRYYTDEVYAATKKICEYIFDSYSLQSVKRYSMVRFTHILDNSLMDMELRNAPNVDYLAIHSPGKYVTAQNVAEAAHLMINALLKSRHGKSIFLIVRNLEWPVESLEVALYYIKESGSSIPVIFKGNPPGYTEKFFRGQLDWSNPQDLNLLINVYECNHKSFNDKGDIIISHISSTDNDVLQKALYNIQNAKGEKNTKDCLLADLKDLVLAALLKVDKHDTVKILQWGLQQQYMSSEGITIAEYGPIVSLLIASLEESTLLEKLENLAL